MRDKFASKLTLKRLSIPTILVSFERAPFRLQFPATAAVFIVLVA